MKKDEEKLYEFLSKKENSKTDFTDIISQVNLEQYKKPKKNYKFLRLSILSTMSCVVICTIIICSTLSSKDSNLAASSDETNMVISENDNSKEPQSFGLQVYQEYLIEIVVKEAINEDYEYRPQDKLEFKNVFFDEEGNKNGVNEGVKIYEVGTGLNSPSSPGFICAYIENDIYNNLSQNNTSSLVDGTLVKMFYQNSYNESEIKWLVFTSSELPKEIQNYKLAGVYSECVSTVYREITSEFQEDLNFDFRDYSIHSLREDTNCYYVTSSIQEMRKWYLSSYSYEEDFRNFTESYFSEVFKEYNVIAEIDNNYVIMIDKDDQNNNPSAGEEWEKFLNLMQEVQAEDDSQKYDYIGLSHLISEYKNKENN